MFVGIGNKFDSNESLNDNDETSSKSSSSNHDPVESNFPFQQFDNDLEGQFLANQTADLLDDEPRTVFNQTYTSWATNDRLALTRQIQHRTLMLRMQRQT